MTTLDATSPTPAKLFGFPNPVNEVSARLVAGGVVAMATLTLLTGWRWMTVLMAYGFVARVLTGPKLSPLGQLVTKVITPRLPVEPRLVAGPPKRFAQGMGAGFTIGAAVLGVGFDRWGAAQVLLGMLIFAASLEAFFGLCLGCKIFAIGIRLGVVPEEVCERCNDIWADRPA